MTISVYMGNEVDEMLRQRDMRENPQTCQRHTFKFDYVYDQDSTQDFVYENTAKHTVMSALEGYNATLLAYGQTGTGKTYTMEGPKCSSKDRNRGIIPRAMEEIFHYIENCPKMQVLLSLSSRQRL